MGSTLIVSYPVLDLILKTDHPVLAGSAADAQLDQLSDLLRELERENVTARRRVRELEIELDHCKVEVERERTRASIQETERARANERQAISEREERERRIRETEESMRSWEGRYYEVVEEKKGAFLVAALELLGF